MTIAKFGDWPDVFDDVLKYTKISNSKKVQFGQHHLTTINSPLIHY